MEYVRNCWRGVLLCLCIAVPCYYLGKAVPVIGGPVFAILIGMALGRCAAGNRKKPLRSPGGNPVYHQVCVAVGGGIAGIWHEFGKRAGNRERVPADYREHDLRVAGGCVFAPEDDARVAKDIYAGRCGVINLAGDRRLRPRLR